MEQVDSGVILAQAVVPVIQGDTADMLAARILVQEHRLYPAVINAIATGGIEIRDLENGVAVAFKTKQHSLENTFCALSLDTI